MYVYTHIIILYIYMYIYIYTYIYIYIYIYLESVKLFWCLLGLVLVCTCFGLKPLRELLAFENDLIALLKNIKLRKYNVSFQI